MANTVITVSNVTELNAALAAATGGETIVLAPGDYGNLTLSGSSAQFASTVTITSEDPANMAVITGLRVENASNITFDHINFDYTYSASDYKFTKANQILNSSGITIQDSIIQGDQDSDGLNTGMGLYVYGSNNVDIINTEITELWKGAFFLNSSNINIIGNEVHTIRADGIVFDSVQNVLFEDNYLHDFSPVTGDHPDMLQIQRASGGDTSDVVIRDNVFDMGTGSYTQTIFVGTSGQDPSLVRIENLSIENNLIYNAHYHGITVTTVYGLNIDNNTVIQVDDPNVTGNVEIPHINVSANSTDVVITDNVSAGINGYSSQSDWTVSNNITIQNTDPTKANYYDNLFDYVATAAQDGYNQYAPKAGGIIETSNAGSTLVSNYPAPYDTWNSNTSDTSTDTSTGGDGSSSPSTTTDTTTGTMPTQTGGGVGDGGTTTTDTSDGTTITDPVIAQSDPDSIVQVSPDEPIPNSNATETELATADISDLFDDYVLDFDALIESGSKMLKGGATVESTANGQAVVLDAEDEYVRLGKMSEFNDAGHLAFTVEYSRDQADGSTQRLVWNHLKVGLDLEEDGLVLHIRNNDQAFHKGIKIDNLGLNDTELHQITVIIDENSDQVQVIVDDIIVYDDSSLDLEFSGGRDRGWMLGTPWKTDFEGEIYDLAIDDDVEFFDASLDSMVA